jgi:ethanolamine utilization cobalamin adenosyltransferase
MLLSSGCNEYTIKTTINPDGSFERTIVCDGNSTAFSNFHLPYVIDSSWSVVTEAKQGAEKEKREITTAKKRYTNSEQLMAEFARGRDSAKLQISCRVEKRFRWFFTYYIYTETLPSYAIFRHEPLDSFFTPTEIGLIKENKDSLLNKRVDEFWLRNSIDEFIDRIEAKAKDLNDPSLPPSAFAEHKQALMEELVKGKNDKPDDITRIVEKMLRPRPVERLRGAMDTTFADITKELEREAELDLSYKNEVSLPGILITSNSKKIEGNKVMWDCKSNRYFNVVMSAESRRVNLWAVIVTSIVCLGLVVGLLLPLIHRTRGGVF